MRIVFARGRADTGPPTDRGPGGMHAPPWGTAVPQAILCPGGARCARGLPGWINSVYCR